MIQGISAPVGDASFIRVRLAIAHVAGGAVGGLVGGVIAWFAVVPLRTMVPEAIVLAAVASGAVAGAAMIDLGAGRRLRRRGTQVPQTWRARLGEGWAFFAYGATLGAGLVSYVPYAVTYVGFAVAALTLPLGLAVLVTAAFGAARASAVAVAALSPHRASIVLYRSSSASATFSMLSAASCLAVAALMTGNLLST